MPEFESWDAFYHSTLQGLWLLWVAPLAFLLYRAVAGLAKSPAAQRDRFVDLFAWTFATLTLLDPVATGPMLRALGISDHGAGTVIMFAFVYLGDFRVLLLLFGLGRPGPLALTLRRAALATLVVPLVTGVVYGTLSTLDPALHGQWQWVIYEVSFMALALGIRAGWLPGLPQLQAAKSPEPGAAVVDATTRKYLREVCAYVAVYYALWAGSDLLILLGGLDAGWGTRVIANQLYYGFFVPFVWLRYRVLFSPR